MVQESLTNVLKHAVEPTGVRGRRCGGDGATLLVLQVTDDGRAGAGTGGAGGHGLAGMRERLALFGGELVDRARPARRLDGARGPARCPRGTQ